VSRTGVGVDGAGKKLDADNVDVGAAAQVKRIEAMLGFNADWRAASRWDQRQRLRCVIVDPLTRRIHRGGHALAEIELARIFLGIFSIASYCVVRAIEWANRR